MANTSLNIIDLSVSYVFVRINPIRLLSVRIVTTGQALIKLYEYSFDVQKVRLVILLSYLPIFFLGSLYAISAARVRCTKREATTNDNIVIVIVIKCAHISNKIIPTAGKIIQKILTCVDFVEGIQ